MGSFSITRDVAGIALEVYSYAIHRFSTKYIVRNTHVAGYQK